MPDPAPPTHAPTVRVVAMPVRLEQPLRLDQQLLRLPQPTPRAGSPAKQPQGVAEAARVTRGLEPLQRLARTD